MTLITHATQRQMAAQLALDEHHCDMPALRLVVHRSKFDDGAPASWTVWTEREHAIGATALASTRDPSSTQIFVTADAALAACERIIEQANRNYPPRLHISGIGRAKGQP